MSKTVRKILTLISVRYFSAAVLAAVAAYSVLCSPIQAQSPFQDGLNFVSDIVPAGVTIANRKVYRQAFSELARDRSYYSYLSEQYPSEQGQQPQVSTSKTFHLEFIGRGAEIQPNEPIFGLNLDNYGLQSYGFQAGGLLKSTPSSAFGINFGYERGFFRNKYNLQDVFAPYRDSIDNTFPGLAGYEFAEEKNSTRFDDYYIGLYYGTYIQQDVEFRSYIGGGHQQYNTSRTDQNYTYKSVYEGASFELNAELSRNIRFRPNGILYRPYIGADIEHTTLESGMEQNLGDLFRYSDRTYLTQLFVRLGLDMEKHWRFFETRGGIGFTSLFLGKRFAKTETFFPGINGECPISTSRLGRFSWNLKAGGNLYLNQAKTQSLYIDYFADIHTDRAGDTAVHTGSFGYAVRY